LRDGIDKVGLASLSAVVAYLHSYLSHSPDSNIVHVTLYQSIAFRLFVPNYSNTTSYPPSFEQFSYILPPFIPRKHSSYDLINSSKLLTTFDLTTLQTSPTATTMFLKQTAYKPRSGSQSSQGGKDENKSSSASPPPKAEATPRKSTDVVPGAISAAAAGRRRVRVSFSFSNFLHLV
jgi:hypothetical protein